MAVLLVLVAGVEDMHPVPVAVEVEAPHLRHICFCEDDDDLLCGYRGIRDSRAGGLCQVPILACRSRSCRRRRWSRLHRVSMLTNNTPENFFLHGGPPMGGGGGGEGCLSRRPIVWW